MSAYSEEDDALASVVKAALSRKGVLSALKSKLRAEIFHVLENKQEPQPEKTKEVYLATELIRDFMTHLKLENSLSVFMEEIGCNEEIRVDRPFIASEVGLSSTNESVPLLLLLIEHLVHNKDIKQSEYIASTNVTYDDIDLS